MGEKKIQAEPEDKLYTLEEYFAFEEFSEGKHEYERGKVLAMSGGTLVHSRLGANMITALNIAIDKAGKNCSVLSSDAKVYSVKKESIVYPDATVVCGEEETLEDDANALTNPMLVVEVLSKSTANYDRSGKFRKYTSIPSFKEYVLIEQETAVVEVFYRQDNSLWSYITYIGLDKEVYLNSLDVSIKMKDIYKGVEKHLSEEE